MRDTESLSPKEKKPFLKWGSISAEFDDLQVTHGLSKAEWRIMAHIERRADRSGWCYSGNEDFAKWTKTNPVYVRWLVRKLIQRKLVIRNCRSGLTSELKLAPKAQWLMANPPGLDIPMPAYEETDEQTKNQILWSEIWQVLPDAPRALFEKYIKEDRLLFERVLEDLKERIKRGLMTGPDRLDALKTRMGYFLDTWKRWKAVNEKAKK